MSDTNEMPENCTPVEASDIKKGRYILIKGRPCKIIDATHHKTGKHGHIKASLVGLDLLNHKKCLTSVPGHAKMHEFDIEKNEYQLISMNEDFLDCLDADNVEHKIRINSDSDMYKEIDKEYQSGKTINVIVIKVPVALSAKKSIMEEAIDSYAASHPVE
ncbi:MAG: putative eukaryotic translation initiation factor 5A-1 [Harvfovirus sp.]|uniref:Putative eukaryotic translation initiation factor 5A-1 n=1 Tax=Harvfovirus sp. TaxID=2487768 RepID=A0A3G5A394_9VIRU|nr:MAG: putative eukaryotic translation initiation factor 5A-1 [Harvfovirus sp.]